MSSMGSTDQQIEHHESLWYNDGNIVLQAQSVLFKVHRSVLAQQSDFFENMFALPSGGGPEETQGTESRPLLVLQVSSSALAHLLTMLYNVSGYNLPLSDDEFVEVLLAAHRFEFRDVLEMVPRHLDGRLSAERKLELGMQCDLEYWQLRPFQELVLSCRPRDPASNKLSDSVWMKVLVARAQVSQARIDHITTRLEPKACGHILAALVSSVPFSSPHDYRKNYWKYRAEARLPPHGTYHAGDLPNLRDYPCCSPYTDFDVTGGPNDRLHTVLLDQSTEHALIAAVWKSS